MSLPEEHLTYYADSAATLYLGDALRVLRSLPDDSVDAVITDPPYSGGGFFLSVKQQDPSKKYQNTETKKEYPPMLGDNKDQRSFLVFSTLWLTEAFRVMKRGSPVLVFSDWRQLPVTTDALQCAGFSWRGIVVWNKRCARPSVGSFIQSCEFIVYASKGKYNAKIEGCLPGIYEHAVNPAKKLHICGKPLPLMKDLMQIVPLGGLVLDPFAGSGTTIRAAKETGRKAIGIELSAEYAEIAANALKNTETQQ